MTIKANPLISNNPPSSLWGFVRRSPPTWHSFYFPHERMEMLISIFGEDENIAWWQMGLRTVVIFFITLLLIRIAGRRTFGRRSAFDTIVSITLGALLSRAITGATPFMSVVTAGLVLVLIHRWLAKISTHNEKIGRLIKGERRCLFADGQIIRENMDKSFMSDSDLLESLRVKGNTESFDSIETIYMEKNGDISIIMKK